MKYFIIISLFFSLENAAFSQSRAQVMAEQIAKYEVYLSFLKQGYDIAKKGLTLIGDITSGDLNLHKDYFNALEQVKTPIKNDPRVVAMVTMQQQMLSSYTRYQQEISASGEFTSPEKTYLTRVFSAVLQDTYEEISELTTLVSNGQLQMKDDERLIRIDQLYRRMSGQYDFMYSFADQLQIQHLQRQQALQEITHLQKIY